MKVTCDGPFAVGIARWRSITPCLSVIVKTTYSLAQDGNAEPSPLQLGLAVDYPSVREPDDVVEYASDFAPRKARAEVLLVGRAYAAQPTPTIPVALEVDGVRRQLEAVTDRPSTAIALSGPRVRANDLPTRVGPRSAPGVAHLARGTAEGYDFRSFNVAPPAQQVDELNPGARLLLVGLLEGANRREVRLAALEPQVLYLPPLARGRSSGLDPFAQDVGLRCDTLWIHSERQLCALTWRGLIAPSAEAIAGARLIVRPRSSRPSTDAQWAELLGRARWTPALEAHAVRFGPPTEWRIDDAPAVPPPVDAAARVAAVAHGSGAEVAGGAVDDSAQKSTLVMDVDVAALEIDKLVAGAAGPDTVDGHVGADVAEVIGVPDTIDGDAGAVAAPPIGVADTVDDDLDADVAAAIDIPETVDDDDSQKRTQVMDVDMAALGLSPLAAEASAEPLAAAALDFVAPAEEADDDDESQKRTQLMDVDMAALGLEPLPPEATPPPKLPSKDALRRQKATAVISRADIKKSPSSS